MEAAMTIDDAARTLRLSRQTVCRLIRSGQIPAVQLGHQWRIRPEALAALMRGRSTDAPLVANKHDRVCGGGGCDG